MSLHAKSLHLRTETCCASYFGGKFLALERSPPQHVSVKRTWHALGREMPRRIAY